MHSVVTDVWLLWRGSRMGFPEFDVALFGCVRNEKSTVRCVALLGHFLNRRLKVSWRLLMALFENLQVQVDVFAVLGCFPKYYAHNVMDFCASKDAALKSICASSGLFQTQTRQVLCFAVLAFFSKLSDERIKVFRASKTLRCPAGVCLSRAVFKDKVKKIMVRRSDVVFRK
jgi:hypothetical protein